MKTTRKKQNHEPKKTELEKMLEELELERLEEERQEKAEAKKELEAWRQAEEDRKLKELLYIKNYK